MWKIDARTRFEKKQQKIIIAFAIISILLVISIIVLYAILQSTKQQELTYDNLKTVEEVLRYYECEYIYEKESSLKDYDVDIKVVFRYDLYDGDVSNEKFFNDVIEDIAKVLNYADFRMIDDEKKIDIKVKCDNYKISEIFINDIANYFIYMNSQKDLAKYKNFANTDLQVESVEILELINNNWNTETNFGTRESIFNSYYNYFDEGVSVRTINNKIYNVVFNKQYKGNIVNGIFPGVENNVIEAKLGTPTFKDEELKVIGYKNNEIYVFFNEKEISVYRVSDVEIFDFFDLADKLLSEELDLLDFMNELTYIWPDYSEYNYNSNSVFISYPLKGIDIKIGYEDTNAIVLYNNIKTDLPIVEKYLENAEFVSRLGVDNLFEAEKRRVKENQSLLEKCNEYMKTLTETEKKKIGESMKYGVYADLDDNKNIIKLCFISRDGTNPNRELYDGVTSYLWCDSQILIYSQSGKGIYAYNLMNGEKVSLIKGNEPFILTEFKDGILKYDDSKVEILF